MHKPYLERDAADIVEQALAMKAEMGLESVDFFSFNFNMYSGFYPLFETCSRLFQRIYLKSQRFDMLAQDRGMAQYQAASGKSVFSCGLEGISRRLRKYLNKNLDDEALLASIDGHRKTMQRLYIGACVVAGLFTLLPGRFLGSLLWGSPMNGIAS